tara:strand:+ start:203 stop:826 length:624 start_codon:yes stop_codon:yes gene_type:complete
MPDLIIKPTNTSGNKVIIQDQGAVTRLQTDDAGITITAPTIANMANCTFPSGKVNNVFRFQDTSGNIQTESTSYVICQTPFSFSATSGRHYIINGYGYVRVGRTGGSNLATRGAHLRTYYGTTSRSASDTTVDTKISNAKIGRDLVSSDSATAMSSQAYSYTAYFTAGSTATHYVYQAFASDSNSLQTTFFNEADSPHNCFILEVIP